MILGIGTDIVEIQRIDDMLKKHQEAFLKKIFTDDERTKAATRKAPSAFYAGRWAVKEAISKALGCGIGSTCTWCDINTINSPSSGRPEVYLSGAAAKTAAQIGVKSIHVSISHEAKYACASVVLEN